MRITVSAFESWKKQRKLFRKLARKTALEMHRKHSDTVFDKSRIGFHSGADKLLLKVKLDFVHCVLETVRRDKTHFG